MRPGAPTWTREPPPVMPLDHDQRLGTSSRTSHSQTFLQQSKMFFSTRQLLLAVAATLCLSVASAHDLPIPHVDQAPAPVINGQTMGLTVAFAQPQQPVRRLRAQHNGEDHGGVISPGGGEVNPQTGVANPGGILGPLYAAFPDLLAPLAMASDTVHNSNAAVSGVQHTPDGIFQA